MNHVGEKQNFSQQELQILASEMEKRKKSTAVAWILWLFFGGLGVHRYYLGKIGTGVAMTLTLGGLGIWTLIDIFLNNGNIRQANETIEAQIIQEIKANRNFSQPVQQPVEEPVQ